MTPSMKPLSSKALRGLNIDSWFDALSSKFQVLMAKRTADGPTCDETLYYLKTEMPLEAFFERLVRYLVGGSQAPISFETLPTAGVLMRRWEAKTGSTVTRDTFYRLLLGALLISVKTLEDTFESNAYYAQVWGVDLQMVNAIEEDFLRGVEWEVCVSGEQYDAFMTTEALTVP